MAVLLRRPDDPPAAGTWDSWFATSEGAAPSLDARRRLGDVAPRLEKAFEEIRPLWWRLGRELAEDPSSAVAVAPTGSVGSDFGVMLAWSRLVEMIAAGPERTLCLCADPWLFRHLASLPNVAAGKPPRLWPARLRLVLRGWLARGAVVARVLKAIQRLRHHRARHRQNVTALLVYGHPATTASYDAYFGDLMLRLPGLVRVLHVDCPAARAQELATEPRTASLHAWGRPWFALTLATVRWAPSTRFRRGALAWLIRRAADHENSGGGPAMIRWQIHCQERWLDAVRPQRVAWPWENLAWERALVRAMRSRSITAIGYQHTVIGRHQINQSPHGNRDGLASVPDLILCNGRAYRDELLAWGVPGESLRVAGAFRFAPTVPDRYDPAGPVLLGMSSLTHANRALLQVGEALAAAGFNVLIKEHPMYPSTGIVESARLQRTEKSIAQQPGLRAVVFATGTTALDALRAGVPAFRLLLDDGIAWDVAPAGIAVPAVTLQTVIDAIRQAGKPAPIDWSYVFAPVDETAWRTALGVTLLETTAGAAA